MSSSSTSFVTVEMGVLKAALVDRAAKERCSVSVIVRRAVERELGLGEVTHESIDPTLRNIVKLSIRFTRDEVEALACNARSAGVSRGVYLASLMADAPATLSREAREKSLTVLSASTAELATMSHALFHLASLLRQGAVSAALEYRETVLDLRSKVIRHLDMAAALLADVSSLRKMVRAPSRAIGKRTS